MRREKSLCPVCIPASKGPTFNPPPLPTPPLIQNLTCSHSYSNTSEKKRRGFFLFVFVTKGGRKESLIWMKSELQHCCLNRLTSKSWSPGRGTPVPTVETLNSHFRRFSSEVSALALPLRSLAIFFASLCSPTHSSLTFSSSVIIISSFFGKIRKRSYQWVSEMYVESPEPHCCERNRLMSPYPWSHPAYGSEGIVEEKQEKKLKCRC